MPSYQNQVHIRAAQDKVFHFLADPEAAKAWVTGLVDIVPSSPGSLQTVGGRFKERVKEGSRIAEYDGEILAYDRPRAYAVRMENGQFTLNIRFALDPSTDGAVLSQWVDVQPRSPILRRVLPLFGFLTRLMLKKQLKQLKAASER
jgi:hypothetical protein